MYDKWFLKVIRWPHIWWEKINFYALFSVLKLSFDTWHKEISAEASEHSGLDKEDYVWRSLNAKLLMVNTTYRQ